MPVLRTRGPIGSLPLSRGPRPGLTDMRAVQITRFGGPESLDVVDLPDRSPGDGEQLFDISACGVNFADTHHSLSVN
ncbi:MAG: putative Zn-dependent oxidoreductase, NADPH:quinone reductase [Modestobacter sp.]|nr:putative Zn-dependent oxidoreductase, NADPH:quinone reductase [Modestobacter sp.]